MYLFDNLLGQLLLGQIKVAVLSHSRVGLVADGSIETNIGRGVVKVLTVLAGNVVARQRGDDLDNLLMDGLLLLLLLLLGHVDCTIVRSHEEEDEKRPKSFRWRRFFLCRSSVADAQPTLTESEPSHAVLFIPSQ